MLTTEQLKHLSPLEHIDHGVLTRLVEVADIQQLGQGECLFEFGSEDDSKVYLLEGELELTAKDGRVRLVKTDESKPAASAIASLVPRQYTVTAVNDAKIIRFENDKFERILNGEEEPITRVEVQEHDEFESRTGVESDIFTQIFIDISSEEFELPNLPEVSTRAMQLLKDEDTDVDQLESIIQADPAIAAKLLKAANSALFGGTTQITSISQAIVRIGFNTTNQLVMGFAMETLFITSSKAIKKLMQNLWYHSVTVASIASVLSKELKRFDSGQALLAGLIHDIGKVAVLSYIDKNNYDLSYQEIEEVVVKLRADIGSMILSKWNFPEEFIGVVEGVEDWHRDHEQQADLCDLVMLAQLHSNIQSQSIKDVPPMFELPAFKKLGLNEWSPETGIGVLEKAQQEVKELISVYS